MMNYKSIEEKWQRAWADAKVFEVEPNDRKPLLVTAAFPYVNSPQHIGHVRTYGTADTYARYMRMMSFNVLYPMAFHASGVPILAFAKRIKNNDRELMEELKIFHVPEGEIEKMVDPNYMADYFIKEMETGMKAAGYGIDWRRKFVSIEPIFSKLVEWQFLKLKEKGYITKGKYPVGWCPNENQTVGQHDTKHDVHPEIEQITVVKFKDAESDAFFGCATYRPETIYGVTNIFIDRNSPYVVAKLNGDRYYLSKAAAENLKYQADLEVESEITAEQLMKRNAINPINGNTIPILPGFFVKAEIGTGVVMSVPAHAPFDYVALQRLKKENYPMPEMEYKRVLEIEKSGDVGIGRSLSDVNSGRARPVHPEIPALAYLEILNTNEDAIDDMIEFATKLLYREESHWGVMLVDDYKNMKEPEARDLIKKKLIESNNATEMYVLSNDEEVYCRCGWKVVVNIVDQWFINYGDSDWKKLARACLGNMRIYPKKLRLNFENVIEWLNLRAAERKQGLGTVFPFDNTSIIESLSDSTLYMCFYTFDYILRNEKIKPEQLKPEFFDYVLLSNGDLAEVAKSTGISDHIIGKCKESFEYWYSNTSRHSAPDLIPNHLTMYIFNHCGLMKERYWPKRIVVNGFVNYEGEKMSKSLGNIVPLSDGIAKFGADPMRFIEITGADLDTDTEFSMDGVNSIYARNDFILKMIQSMHSSKSKELSHIDYWLYSKLNSKIRSATQFMDNLNLKGSYTEIYYNSVNELKKYTERGGNNEIVMRDFLEKMVLMLAPAMPHVAEEYWSTLGKNTLAAQEQWPNADEQMINLDEELIEEIIDNTINDVRQSIELTRKMDANRGKNVKRIKLIMASQWKVRAYNIIAKTRNMNSTINSKELEGVEKNAISKYLAQFTKRLNMLSERRELDMGALQRAFLEAKDYIRDKFSAEIGIEDEEQSKSERAFRALPEKPCIDVTWG